MSSSSLSGSANMTKLLGIFRLPRRFLKQVGGAATESAVVAGVLVAVLVGSLGDFSSHLKYDSLVPAACVGLTGGGSSSTVASECDIAERSAETGPVNPHPGGHLPTQVQPELPTTLITPSVEQMNSHQGPLFF